MIYELRTYWVEPKFRDGYQEWANNHALPLMQGKHGFRVVGFWVVESLRQSRATFPADDEPFTVAWMLAWKDQEERDAAWTQLLASPEWAGVQQATREMSSRIASEHAGSEDEAKLRELADTHGWMSLGYSYLLRGITRSPLQ